MTSLGLAVPLVVVSVLGLLLNSYILFIVLLTKQAQTANNLLLLHLSIVDSLLSITFLIFSAPEMLRGWIILGLPCNLHGFLFTLLHPVALWTICGLNCDRYYAITAPLHYGTLVNVRKVAMGLGLAWIISLVLCMPPLFKVAPYKHNPGLAGCAPDFGHDTGAWWYSITYISVTWLLPTVLILGCNLRVLTIARYHRHRIASAIFEVTISAQVTITHQRNPFFLPANKLFRGRSAISTVLQLVISFLVLYCPYYGAILWDSSSSNLLPSWRAHPLVFTVASCLLTCSPPVNGLLYGVKSKVLRTTFKNFWRKQMSKCEVNQEIQARTPSTCGSRRPSITTNALPRPASVQLPRRLSEMADSRIQRISSELSWRPHFETDALRRSTSCRENNSLQPPPVSTIDLPSFRVFRVAVARSKHTSNPNLTATNIFLQRVFGVQQQQNKRNAAIQTVLATTPRSPRILITRAFSEESEPSPPATQRGNVISKTYSSSTTLLDRQWKKLRYQDEEDMRGSENSVGSAKTESESLMLTTPKRDVRSEDPDTDSSSSSSTSDEEHSSGNIYFPFDDPAAESPMKTTNGLINDDAKSCDGLWMKPCGGLDPIQKIDLEMARQFYQDRDMPCIFSWPTRRKTTKTIITRSITDIAPQMGFTKSET